MRRAAGYSSEDNRQWVPPMPNLPGARTHGPMEPRPKGQTLRFVNGYPIAEDVQNLDPLNREHRWNGRVQDVGPTPPFAVHDATTQVTAPQKDTPGSGGTAGSAGGARVPNWITYDRKVLGFGAYFQEDVPYSALESWRVRRVTIKYYLENDQVEIVEAREVNSGLPQGILLRRHSAAKGDGSQLRWPDLRVGGQLSLYRRTYHLVSADAATRAFYTEQGQEQPPDLTYPEGPYDQRRKGLEASRGDGRRPPTRGSAAGGTSPPPPPRNRDLPVLPCEEEEGKMARTSLLSGSPRGTSTFFRLLPRGGKPSPETEERDHAVLRFLAAWDNTGAVFGEVLSFAMTYHVVDGTIEVREVNRRNSGRDPFPLLLSRSRLPKVIPPVHGRPMSPASRRRLNIPYYDWRDLYLGAMVNVYGRQMLLYDCDDATLAWLKKYVPGLMAAQLTPIPVDFDPFGPKRPPLSIPPHLSGIGSEEDSLQNVLRLVPRPLTRSYCDYVVNGNKVLRFAAVMVPLGADRPLVGPHDAERRFVVSLHLGDGTLSVFEPRQVNSGMEQGTFLERTRVPNPATGQQYVDTDLQVGAILEVYGRGFQLLEADKFTLEHMEEQRYRFPWADYDKVLSKLTTWLNLYSDELPDKLRDDLVAADANGSGYITKYQLYELLTALGADVTPHEVITLVRQLGADRQGLLVEQLLAALRLAPPLETSPPLKQPPPQPQAPEEPPHPPAPPVPFPGPGLRIGAWPPYRRVAWGPSKPIGSSNSNNNNNKNGPAKDAAGAATAASAAAAAPYPRLGPMPGHPHVDVSPAPSQRHAYGVPYEKNYYHSDKADVGAGKLSGWSSLTSSVDGAGYGGYEGAADVLADGDGDDRQHQRDTPEKNNKNSWRKLLDTPSAAAAATPSGHGAAGSAGGARPAWAGRGPSLTTGIKQPASLWQTTNMAFGGVGHAASFQRR